MCLHLLVAVLLVLTTVRAVTERGGVGGSAAILVTAVLFAALYAAGAILLERNRSPLTAGIWLSVLGAVWLVLLALTQDGVWLAFPLFFIQLHLLPRYWGVAAVAFTTVAAIGGFGWHQHAPGIGMLIGPVLGAAFAVATVLGYQALYRENEQRRRLLDQLTATRHDLAAAERTAGVLAERERLAREIHDTLAQGLSSIQLLLRAAERTLAADSSPALVHVERAREAAVDNLAEARRFVRDWSPPDLEAGSLPTALHRLCETTSAETGMAVHCHISGDPIALPTAQEIALWRIAQSALANTTQHAAAQRVELTLSYMDTEVALDVVDDGRGFDPAEVPTPGTGPGGTGFGLAAMRARARSLGGSFVIESAEHAGTAIAVTLPCPMGDREIEAVKNDQTPAGR